MDVREAAAAIGGLGRAAVASLVFGPETNGLTNAEIACCGPAPPSRPIRAAVLQPLHAVAIAAYEVFRASGAEPRRPGSGHPRPEGAPAGSAAGGFLAIEALPRSDRRHLRRLAALVQRSDLTAKDLKLLEHVARKMTRAAGRGVMADHQEPFADVVSVADGFSIPS